MVRSFVIAAMLAAAPAAAATVDLSGAVNADLNSSAYTGGSFYPEAGTTPTITVGGQTFALTTIGTDGHTGVVATGYPNSAVTSVAIGTSLYGLASVDVLINAAFPVNSVTTIGRLAFGFASGTTYSADLTNNINIRDHVTPTPFADSNPFAFGTAEYAALDPSGTQITVRLDAVRFLLLPAAATDTLTSITLFNDDPASGSPFIAAITTNAAPTVPEPATWGLMLLGFGLTGAALRRRRVAGTFA